MREITWIVPEVSEQELGWLAGFYEGEGNCQHTVSKGRTAGSLWLNFAQKDLEPLEHVERLLGRGYRTTNKKGTTYLIYRGVRAAEVMDLLYPLLSARRQAQIAWTKDRWVNRKGAYRRRPNDQVCSRGHDLTVPRAIYVDPSRGWRTCRRCRSDASKRSRAKLSQAATQLRLLSEGEP